MPLDMFAQRPFLIFPCQDCFHALICGKVKSQFFPRELLQRGRERGRDGRKVLFADATTRARVKDARLSVSALAGQKMLLWWRKVCVEVDELRPLGVPLSYSVLGDLPATNFLAFAGLFLLHVSDEMLRI